MSTIQTLKELQDQFVAKHGGYFYTDPCFPHDSIPRFCADGTDLAYLGSNLGWCAVLNIKGTALQEQCDYVPRPTHPENGSDETRDFWRWSLTIWYRALVEKAKAKAEATAKKAPRLYALQQEFRDQFREQTGQDIVFVHVPVLNIPYPILYVGSSPAPALVVAAPAAAEFSSDTKECWAWMGFLQAKGHELAKAAGVKGSEETRTFLSHKCWGLWMTVTWYENLCWTLNGRPIPLSETLTERDRDMVRRLRLAEPEPVEPEKATVPTLKDLQAEFIEINPKRIAFVSVPTLRIPFPVDTGKGSEAPMSPNSEDYWQWIGFIEERGQELAASAVSDALPSGGVKGSQEPRYAPEHKCWRLWIAVTWYEDLYCTLTGSPKSRSLMERDRDMSAIVLRTTAAPADAGAEEISHRERAHAEDVETLRGLLDAKDREIQKLRAALAASGPGMQALAAIKCIVDP